MNLKLLGWNDTIVALATPSGIGAIGVIRLSGPDAINITAKLFPKKPLAAQPSHTLHVGYLQSGDHILDEVVVALYKSPKSYTGENVTEISCHGSPYIQEQIIQACISEGARLARPGEFTQRAFLAGKLDLTQAEAVADLIASESSAARDAALHNLRGGFATELKIVRDELISVSALLELELDFAGEDVEFADRVQLYSLLQNAAVKVQRMADSFKLGNAVKNGVKVAIIGKPNAGKSTLLNTLLNEERAIVSEIAGTTRDTIEEVLNIDGILFRFIDTAGLRDESSDIIESIGIGRSRKTAAEADIILYVYDAASPDIQTLDEVQQWLASFNKPYLFLLNKTDIALHKSAAEIENAVLLSARERTGIDELKQQLKALIAGDGLNPETTLITNSRHYTALQQILHSIQEIKAGMDAGLPGDLLSIDMRTCLHYLGEITGEITNEDQLDYIFSKFCIGK